MDNVDIESSPTSLKKINKFSSVVIFLFSTSLSFLTINFLFYGKRFDLGMDILFGYILAPVLLIVLSIFYFKLIKKVYNPKLLIPFLLFVIIIFFSIYYFRIRSPEPYPAYITTVKQVYFTGDQVEFSIIPKDLDTVYFNSNSINVPIAILLPDGSTIKDVIKITPTTSHCESNMFFSKCKVVEKHFGLGASSGRPSIFTKDVYRLTQAGKYEISSDDKSVQGTSFEVKPAIIQQFEQQINNDPQLLFPNKIGSHLASLPHKIHTSDNSIMFNTLYSSQSYLNTYVSVDVRSFNSAELADASREVDTQVGERIYKFGQQVIQTFKAASGVNQVRFNTPLITWVSDNKIISVWATDKDNSPMDDFLEVFLEKYPSTLKKNTSDVLPLPGAISSYVKTGYGEATTISGYTGSSIRYSSLTSGGISVEIYSSNSLNKPINTDLSNFLKNFRAYDFKDITINNQTLSFVWTNAYGQRSPYFPEEVGIPVISWISGNKIISLFFQKDNNNLNFSFEEPSNSVLIKAILDVYPSAL